MATGEYKLRVTVDGAEVAKSKLAGMGVAGSGAMGSIRQSALSMAKAFIGPLATIVALRKSFKLLTQAAAGYEKQMNSVRKVDAILASSGRAAEFAATNFQQLASDLQKISNFGDEDILAQATVGLLRFDAITAQVFPRVQELVVNVASETGSLSDATKMLGISMGDPILGLTRLRRAGVLFTKEQENMIRTLVGSGKQLEAQGVLLTALEKKYDNLAISGVTMTTRLKNAWGDYLEYVGSYTYKVINGVQAGLSAFFASITDENSTMTEDVYDASIDGMIKTAIAFGEFLVGLNAVVKGFATVMLSVVTIVISTAQTIVSGVASAIHSVFAFLDDIPSAAFRALAGWDINILKEALDSWAEPNEYDLWVTDAINQVKNLGGEWSKLGTEISNQMWGVRKNLNALRGAMKRKPGAGGGGTGEGDGGEGDETPGDIGDIIAKENLRLALARELIANTKLLGLTEQQYFDERRVLLADALEQYKNYGMDQSYIDLIRATEEKKWAAEYKELMSQMPENLAAYYEEMKFLDADYYGLRKEQIINYVEALGLSAEQQVLLMGKMFKDLDKEQKEFLDSTKATGIAWADHVNAVLETYMELGATQAEYEKWRTNQIENEIRALADLGVDSELLNVLLRQRLDLLGQEYEAYQKLRDEAAMDAWIEQHELQYEMISNTVDIVTEGFATMIREGKTFGETMSDIWQNWVDMAIEEVQRLIAKLITAWIIKQLITAVSGGTGGAADVVGFVAGAKSYGGTGAGGLILGGGGSEVSLLVNELRQMRREMLGGLTAPVTMNWRKGEMHRAVAEDGLHRQVI